ncbi:MAG TPA: TonB-dependent receptor, partial [Cyclobacteriaceae bacterium]
MFKSMILATVVLLSMSARAQEFSITGSVRDGKGNQVLAGATVQLETTNRIAVTDEYGRFRLDKLTAGDYSMVVKFLGFQPKTEKVSVTSNTELTISLEESSQITDEVVVYATRANEKTPTTFTNVSKQALQKQNFGQDLPLLLNWTPSLVTTSDAGTGIGYTGLRIRGSDATRINVTINGIPYNDSESQGTFWVDIPDVASSTQSVQVQRGVGTSTNGGSAFGGSVNLQTNSLQTDPYAEGMIAAGSFNTQR